ncbi:hypothetical protein BC497_30095 (plasmid) [Klebsiella variicola]|nr:hypothetical protein BC497_30095 [Klebsiella variicola]
MSLWRRVGAYDQSQLSEFILDRADEGATEEEIIKELLRSGLLDDSKNSIAGRIALREYSFVENDTEVESYQVAGVETVRALRQRGLCHSTYLFLLHWYEHLVCDDNQTIPGAKIWAGL